MALPVVDIAVRRCRRWEAAQDCRQYGAHFDFLGHIAAGPPCPGREEYTTKEGAHQRLALGASWETPAGTLCVSVVQWPTGWCDARALASFHGYDVKIVRPAETLLTLRPCISTWSVTVLPSRTAPFCLSPGWDVFRTSLLR